MTLNISDYIIETKKLLENGYENISVLKINQNISDVIIHFNINSKSIKITTDFNKYCLAEFNNDVITNFNLNMVFKKKTPDIIIKELCMIDKQPLNNSNPIKLNDSFHIFQKLDEFFKVPINFINLESQFIKFIETNKINKINTNFPKELLLLPHQITQLIINEIKKINRNKEYPHYIIPDITNPYSLIIRVIFESDYMEFKLNIDPTTYPFVPPKLEYIKPKIKYSLLLALINLPILQLDNWNPTISLEYLIVNIAKELEPIYKDYLIINSDENIYNDLDYELIKLAAITKESCIDKVVINIAAPKINKNISNNISNKYWKSGTGYGVDGTSSWDIKTYIKEQELQNNELVQILTKINLLINSDNIDKIIDSVLINYIINQLKGLSGLELDKNKPIYVQIFNILANLIDKPISQSIINKFSIELKNIYEELEILFSTSNDEINLQIYCTIDYYINVGAKICIIKDIIISDDIKEQYCQIMKPLQFGCYEISSQHRFNNDKISKPEQKALMRILSEISSFKSGLPLNWESTIWVRVPKDSFNLISFIISGPKDTPYENGLFEFHAYFPHNYPNEAPQVLLHTTGNDTVRFNPNLYNTGKVCLSLLGTWSGQEGEKWNPKNSSFLQVMVSIQSLILVEQPYFNEPGWERKMNTPEGKKLSNDYNQNLHPHTIQLAMSNMLLNPPSGFEDVVINHFKMKKEEIINKTLLWEQEATKYKTNIETNRCELISLLNKL
jgi:ubiquitin-protein ligase